MTAFETSVPPQQRHREMKAAEERERQEAHQRGREARTSTQERRPGITRPGNRPLRHVGRSTLLRFYPPALAAFDRCVIPALLHRDGPDVDVMCACGALPVRVEYGATGLCECDRVFINLGDEVRICATEPNE